MRYVVSPEAAAAVVDDGAVVLHMRTKRYYSLNETGTTIWTLLESATPVSAIVASLMSAYDVDRDAAESAVALMLQELASAELVTIEDA